MIDVQIPNHNKANKQKPAGVIVGKSYPLQPAMAARLPRGRKHAANSTALLHLRMPEQRHE
jgi:hypothetical protein